MAGIDGFTADNFFIEMDLLPNYQK